MQEDRVVVHQDGQSPRAYPHNTRAYEVLMGVTGSVVGALRQAASGLNYAGSMRVPAGQYEIVPGE
jgi:hypothetical protein